MGSTLLAAALLLSLPVSAKPNDPPYLAGTWAGDGFAVNADAHRVTVQNDCAHGRMPGPVQLGSDGGFSAKGFFNPPRSGYHMADLTPRDVPAKFTGRLSGDTLLLTITAGGHPGTQHRLTRNAAIKFRKCL